MQTNARRPGLSLIEVIVSTVILGVVSIAYAATFRGQISQKDAYEDLSIAMEMASRQIEFLRSLDFRRAANGDLYASPFNSIFNGYGTASAIPCPDGTNARLRYGGPPALLLDFDMVNDTAKGVEGANSSIALPFLTGGTFQRPPPTLVQAGNAVVLPDRFTVGAPIGTLASPGKPVELWMPRQFLTDARNYSAVVRATRVQTGPGLPVQPYGALVHFQVSVFKGQVGDDAGRRPVLVLNFLREADLL